jgi:hypothetical protein
MVKIKLKPLDVVMTKYKTLCVVNEVSVSGDVSLVLPENSTQKYAWYNPNELTYIGKLAESIKENVV